MFLYVHGLHIHFLLLCMVASGHRYQEKGVCERQGREEPRCGTCAAHVIPLAVAICCFYFTDETRNLSSWRGRTHFFYSPDGKEIPRRNIPAEGVTCLTSTLTKIKTFPIVNFQQEPRARPHAATTATPGELRQYSGVKSSKLKLDVRGQIPGHLLRSGGADGPSCAGCGNM